MTEPNVAPPAPAPAPEKAGLFEDFIDIVASPAKVFERRTNANAFVPYLIVCLLLIGLYYASRNMMEPLMDAEMARRFEAMAKANPQMTPDVIDKAKAVGKVTAAWGVLVGIPIGLLLLSFCTWLVGKIYGGTLTYGTAVMISSYAWIPKVLDSIARMAQGLLTDVTKLSSNYQLTFSAARFLDPGKYSPPMLDLAGRADLFVIWTTVLLAIGLVTAGKVPRERGWMAGLTLFVIGSLTMIWGAIKGG